MKKLLKVTAIIALAIVGIALLKGGQILSLTDHIGLWCITAIGYIVAPFIHDV